MFKMIERFRRRRAIRRCIERLGPLLRKRYGVSPSYAVGQLAATGEVLELDKLALSYGYAFYCRDLSWGDLAASLAVKRDLAVLRQEVADIYFHGDPGFTVEAAVELGMVSESLNLEESNRHISLSG